VMLVLFLVPVWYGVVRRESGRRSVQVLRTGLSMRKSCRSSVGCRGSFRLDLRSLLLCRKSQGSTRRIEGRRWREILALIRRLPLCKARQSDSSGRAGRKEVVASPRWMTSSVVKRRLRCHPRARTLAVSRRRHIIILGNAACLQFLAFFRCLPRTFPPGRKPHGRTSPAR
jgi:hypothetical protein